MMNKKWNCEKRLLSKVSCSKKTASSEKLALVKKYSRFELPLKSRGSEKVADPKSNFSTVPCGSN